MLKTIKNSDLDNEKLSQAKSCSSDDNLDDFDFFKAIVKKPWGHEYLTYQTEELSIWILHIKKDYLTSMHCHPNKRTTLIVLSGKARVSTLKENFDLKEGDGLIIDKKVFHSTKAISEQGIILMEIESPSKKTDLVRLKDDYGRETKGYELQNEMCFDLSKYERVYIDKDKKETHRKIGDMNIFIKNFDDSSSIQHHLKMFNHLIIIMLSGKMVNNKTNEVFTIGEVLEIDRANKIEDLIIEEPIKIMTIDNNILDFD